MTPSNPTTQTSDLMTSDTQVTVTEADREAAAGWADVIDSRYSEYGGDARVDLAEDFARHRLTAYEQGRADERAAIVARLPTADDVLPVGWLWRHKSGVEKLETYHLPPHLADDWIEMPLYTRTNPPPVECGRIHADGSRSSGQPPCPPSNPDPIAVAAGELCETLFPFRDKGDCPITLGLIEHSIRRGAAIGAAGECEAALAEGARMGVEAAALALADQDGNYCGGIGEVRDIILALDPAAIVKEGFPTPPAND